MSEKVLVYKREGKVGKVMLNRPKVRNALNNELVENFGDIIRKADADPKTNVILLCAAGDKAFTAGFDLKESIETPIIDVPARRENSLMELNNFRSIWEAKKPVIAAVQGYCIGGGVWMSFLCDLLIASEDAMFGEPELKYSYINNVLVEPWKMTMNRVKQLVFLGDFMSAKDLKEAGVVNFVVPADKLDEEAMKLANRLADQPAESIRMLKYEINKTYEIMGMRNAMDFAAEMFNLCRINQTQEQAEFNKIVNEQGLKAALAWKSEAETDEKQ
ncbi:enoyl-CoA hydratase/isomerase family protein [Murdochiella massiliensis]|uniref:enoyl-CoA hydratase/isomerase family protein n=1 Tax=Murdochiella massiliensis TaxID=1673723 RepID=UPI000834DCD0|nr:enoyl-CoA hydratase-related protein [Murdochiella massiliensis]